MNEGILKGKDKNRLKVLSFYEGEKNHKKPQTTQYYFITSLKLRENIFTNVA